MDSFKLKKDETGNLSPPLLLVYLDDERPTPEGWTRTYTVQETIALLETRKVVELSLDNDLGIYGKENEGLSVLRWLEEKCDPRNPDHDPKFPIPIVHAHTANLSARRDMQIGIIKLNAWKASRENI